MTEKSEVAKIAAELMETVLQKMSLSGELLTEENEEEVQILVRGSGLGLLIGKHGRTLEALQFILSIVANKNAEIKKRVSLDIE
ncbi:MAG: KH domain-containing protein, partial [Candidatus Subteraquimicrobiales bacterium]|nr:KH domain-containing protein [Candidatus Subteraquimicrobiales bacterium]